MLKFAKTTLLVAFGLTLVTLGSTAVSWGGAVPEIDPSSGMSALALIAGAAVIVRARAKK